MLVDEIRTKSDEELRDMFEDLKEELYKLRLNHVTGELVDTSQFRKTRRTVGRIQTVLRERELATAMTKES